MKLLTKEQIISVNDRKTADIQVPEWGGAIRLVVMSGAERDAFHASREGRKTGLSDFEAALLAATIVDAEGKHVFTAEDIESLSSKNKDVLDRLSSEAATLNGFGAKAQENAEKNSVAATSGDSGSASPSTLE